MALSHDSLENRYRTDFSLMKHHNLSLTELDGLIPWEREIYLTLLKQYVEEENERIKQQNRKLGNM